MAEFELLTDGRLEERIRAELHFVADGLEDRPAVFDPRAASEPRRQHRHWFGLAAAALIVVSLVSWQQWPRSTEIASTDGFTPAPVVAIDDIEWTRVPVEPGNEFIQTDGGAFYRYVWDDDGWNVGGLDRSADAIHWESVGLPEEIEWLSHISVSNGALIAQGTVDPLPPVGSTLPLHLWSSTDHGSTWRHLGAVPDWPILVMNDYVTLATRFDRMLPDNDGSMIVLGDGINPTVDLRTVLTDIVGLAPSEAELALDGEAVDGLTYSWTWDYGSVTIESRKVGDSSYDRGETVARWRYRDVADDYMSGARLWRRTVIRVRPADDGAATITEIPIEHGQLWDAIAAGGRFFANIDSGGLAWSDDFANWHYLESADGTNGRRLTISSSNQLDGKLVLYNDVDPSRPVLLLLDPQTLKITEAPVEGLESVDPRQPRLAIGPAGAAIATDQDDGETICSGDLFWLSPDRTWQRVPEMWPQECGDLNSQIGTDVVVGNDRIVVAKKGELLIGTQKATEN